MTVTRADYMAALDGLRDKLMRMGVQVDAMLDSAVRALVEQDVDAATAVVVQDDQVDAMDVEIEAICMRMIATQQPVARDLRLIGTAIKAITDLERIGDYAVDIAKIGRRLARKACYRPLVDVPLLAGRVREMLHDVLQAFVNRDLDMVFEVIRADDAVDDLYHQQRDCLIRQMQSDPRSVYLSVQLLFAVKYIERIADHIVNVAERVYFVEKGELAQLAKSHQSGAEASRT